MGRDRRSEVSSLSKSKSKSKSDRDDRKGESSSRRDKGSSAGRRSSEHTEDRYSLDRTMSRERDSEHAEGKRKDRSSKRISRSRTMDEYGTESSLARAGDDRSGSGSGNGSGEMIMGMQGSGQFSAQIGATGFNPFPGQNDSGAGRPPNVEHAPPEPVTSAHVQDQFPGQDPGAYTTPYRPPVGANDGGPGLAADYYGDQGESVAAQPGVRPQGPSVIMGEQTHLFAASSVPAPPAETGSGSAQDYFVGDNHAQDNQNNEHGSHSKPPRPSKPGKHDLQSGIAVASAGAALGYVAGHANTTGSQTSILANASQTEHTSIHGQMSSAPEVPTLGNMSGKLDGKHHHSNAGMYAAGAAGLAAGAYALGHSGQHSKPSSGSQLPTYSEVNGPHGSHPHNQGYMGAMATRETDKGPLRRFVDWWKDYEDVRKMEEYTEYIGVCRDCFDPGTSAIDAPRKHHYHGRRRRRKSNGHRPSRVDKGSRYSSSSSSSSSDSEGGGNAAAWIGTAAAGYGIAKLGKAFFKGSDSDSDHKHSGRYGAKAHRQHREGQLPYSGSVRRNSSHNGHGSSSIHTVTKRRSRSQDFGHGQVVVDAKQQKFIRRRRSSSRSRSTSRSSSNSSDGRSAVIEAGMGIAAGATAASYLRSSNRRKGSRSPELVMVRKKSEHRNGRTSSGSIIHAGETRVHRGSRRSGSSHHDVLHDASGHGHDHIGSSSAVMVKRKRSKRKHKSKGGFSIFGNASSSSLSEDGLAFGPGLSRKRSTKRKSSDEKLNAALLGLGATAGALAIAQGKGAKSKTKSSNIYLGAQGRKGHDMRPIFDREDGWESASDDGGSVSTASSCSSSAESALAFGGAVYGSKSSAARKSQESLASDSSGTGKWGWRWGSKKKSKKRVDKGSVMATTAAAVALGGAASSTTSLPSVQHVHPIQTTDPTRFEASRRIATVPSVQTPLVMASRPEPTSVQPQPVKPISNALYTTEASAYPPGYTVTSGPSQQQFPPFEKPYSRQPIPGPGHLHQSSTFSADHSRDYVAAADRPERIRRRSSPTSMSAARDAALVGVTAGTVVSVLSNGKKKDRSSSAAVRFHGVKGDDDHIERMDDEPDSRRERRRQRNEARQERLRLEEERECLRQMRREEVVKMKEEQYRDVEVSDLKMVRSEDSHAPITAPVVGLTGAAVAAAAVAAIPGEDTGTKIVRAVEVVPDQNTSLDDQTKSAIFDPDYFVKRGKAKHQAQLQECRSADKIVADLEKRYQEGPQSMATFFAPPELMGQSNDMSSHVSSVIVPSSDGDRSIQTFATPTIVTIEPPEGMQPPSSLFYNVSKGDIQLNRIAPPWGVPRLNLIEPTPPASRANSVFSASSSPVSPASVSDESAKENGDEQQQRRQYQSRSDIMLDDARHDVAAPASKSDSVTWGNSQTMVLQKEPVVYANAKDAQPLSRDLNGETTHEFKDAILGEDVEEIIGDARAIKEDDIIRSTSPEVEPIVVEPDDDEDKTSKAIPAAVVFEAISGFGPEDVLEEQSGKGENSGFVEGEVEEESNYKIPGGFDEDGSRDIKSINEVGPVIEEVHFDDDTFTESNNSKKQTKKQKKKDKAAKRYSKDPEEDTVDRRGASRDIDLETEKATASNEDDEASMRGNATPPYEIEPFLAKKSKKAKNRKNVKEDASRNDEVLESQESMGPPATTAAIVDIVPDNKLENVPNVENINDDVENDFNNDTSQNFTMSKKKSKKNKKGKDAKAGKDDGWIESNADIVPRAVEVAEPSAGNNTFAFAPVSKKDKKKAKRSSKWANVISAVGGAAAVQAVDDVAFDDKRSSNNLEEKKVNGDAGLSDALEQDKDAFYDSRNGPQAECEPNEGTGTRRRDDDDKAEHNYNRDSTDTIIAENFSGNGERFLGDRAVKEEEASLSGEPMLSSRSITNDTEQPSSNLPRSSKLLNNDFSITLSGLYNPQTSAPTGSGSGSDSPKSPTNRMADQQTSPEQRSTTPIDRSHDEQPVSLKESRANSTTSIPLRFRNPNVSPGTPRNMSFSSPVAQSASSPVNTPSRPRQQKSHSVDYRSTSALPLYLVERTRQIPPIEESLPSLPSSRTTSRSNSIYGSGDDDFESVREYPRSRSAGSSPMSAAMAITSAPISRTSSLFGQAEDDNAELLGSQQATPKASTFPQGTPDLPEIFPDLDLNASGSDEAGSREIAGIEDNEESFISSRTVPAHLSLTPVTVEPKISHNDDLSYPMENEPLNLEDLPKLPDSDPPSPTTSQDFRDWDNEDNRRESVITVIGGNAADELIDNFKEDDLLDTDETRTADTLEAPFATPMIESSENIQLSSDTFSVDDSLNKDHPLTAELEDTNLVPTIGEAVIPSSVTDTLDLVADGSRSAEDGNDEIRETTDNDGTRNLVTEYGPVIPLNDSPIINKEETAPPNQGVADDESNEQTLHAEDTPAPSLSRQTSKKKAKKDKKGKKAKAIRDIEEFELVQDSTDVPTLQEVNQDPEKAITQEFKDGKIDQANEYDRSFNKIDDSVDKPMEVSAVSKKQKKKNEKRKGRKVTTLEDDTIYSKDVSEQASDIQEHVVTEAVKEEPIESSMDLDVAGKEAVVQPINPEEISADDHTIFFETKTSKEKGKKGKKGKMPVLWDEGGERTIVEHTTRELPDVRELPASQEVKDERDAMGEDSGAQPTVSEEVLVGGDGGFFETKTSKKKGKKGKEKDAISSYDDAEEPIIADNNEGVSNTQMSLASERDVDEVVDPSDLPATAENVKNIESITPPQIMEAGDDEFFLHKSSKKDKKKKGKTAASFDAEDKVVLPRIDKPAEADTVESPTVEPYSKTVIVEEQEGRIEDFQPDASRGLSESADDFQRPLTAKERKKAKKAKKDLSRIDVVANETIAVENPESEDIIPGEQMATEESAESVLKREIEAVDKSQTDEIIHEGRETLRESAEIRTADDLGTEDSLRKEPVVLNESAEPFHPSEDTPKTNKEPLESAEDTKDAAPNDEDAFEIFPVSRSKGKKDKKGKKSKRQSTSLGDTSFSTSDVTPNDTRDLPALGEKITNEELEAVEDPLTSRKASRKKEKKAKKSKKGLLALDSGDNAGVKEEAAAPKEMIPADAEVMEAAAVSLPDADVSEEIGLVETGYDNNNIEPRSQDQPRSLPIAPLGVTDINDVHDVSDCSLRDNDIVMQDAVAVPLPDENLDPENGVAMIDQTPSVDRATSSLHDNYSDERAIEEARVTALPEMAPTEKEELQDYGDSGRVESATPFDEEPRDLTKSLMHDSEDFVSQPQSVPLPKDLDHVGEFKREQLSCGKAIPFEEATRPDPSSVPLPEGDDRETADLGSKRIDKFSNSTLDDAAVTALPISTDDELISQERSFNTKPGNLALADDDLSNKNYEDRMIEDARHIPLPDVDDEESATVVQRPEGRLQDVIEQAKVTPLPMTDVNEAVNLEDRFGGDRRDEVIESAKELKLPDSDFDEALALQEKALDQSDLGDGQRIVAPSVRDTEETEVLHMPEDGDVESSVLDEAREISLPMADDKEISVLEERDANENKDLPSKDFPSIPLTAEGQDVLNRSENYEMNNMTQLEDKAKSLPLPKSIPDESTILADPENAARSISLEDAQAVPLPNDNMDELDGRKDDIKNIQIRDVRDAEELPSDTEVKFAATVAAGLQDSGFDPNIVIADPAFSRRSSPTNPSAALESENISFAVKKGKKGKKGKKKSTEPSACDTGETQNRELLDQGRVENVVDKKPSTSSNLGDDEFTADVLTGLRSSGFDPKVLEESNSTTRADPMATPEAEPEEVFAMVKKPKKGKKGKKTKTNLESKHFDKTQDSNVSNANNQHGEDDIKEELQDKPVSLDSTQGLWEAQKDTQDRSLSDESLNISKDIVLPESSNEQTSVDKIDREDSDIAVNALSRTQSNEANESAFTKRGKKNKKGKKKFQGLAVADTAESSNVPILLTGENLNFESADQTKSPQDLAKAELPPQANLLTEDRTLEEVQASKSPPSQITAPEPAWSFSSVRDSAVVVPDTPIVSQSVAAVNTSRDSGYIGSPNGQELDQDFNYRSLSAGATSAEGRSYGDGDAMKTTVDDKDAPRDVETIEDESRAPPNSARETLTVKTSFLENDNDGDDRKAHLNISPVHSAGQISSSPRDIDNKNNSKAVASPKSPTSARDIDTENTSSVGPIIRSKGKKKKKKNKSSYSSEDKEAEDYFMQDSGDKDSTPKVLQEEVGLRSLTATPSATLETIHERNSQVSPVHKTTRSMSDVGSPDHGLKSARRTSTPKPNIGERVRYSPASAASSSTHNKRDVEKSQISTEDILSRLSWPPVDEENETVELDRSFKVDPSKFAEGQHRSPSTTSNWSNGSAGKFKTPDFRRPTSAHSNASSTHSLRRTDRSISGDLRAASRLGDPIPRSVGRLSTSPLQESPLVRPPSHEPLKGRGERRTVVMAEIYEGVGDSRDSPRSPTRPPSVRKRQSLQIIDLEARLDRLSDERRQLQEAAINAEHQAEDAARQREVDTRSFAEEVASRDQQLHERQSEIQNLEASFNAVQQEVIRLTEANRSLTELNSNLQSESETRFVTLEAERDQAHQQWNETSKLLEQMRQQHHGLSARMEGAVEQEIRTALDDKNAELDRLREELDTAMEEIRTLQEQTLASKQTEDYLNVRDEDYFDSACQQLCQHVQQWVLRFSKFSDHRACRLSTDITDEKIEARLDNAILDGSDVDALLADRVKRRDVFMSVVMTMIWEFVFTRYLFGMEREQRQKLKALEKTLLEIGPARAVAQWRATTLTLLSRHQASFAQREQDTEAVVHEVYDTLATLLPPPSNLRTQIMTSLRNVMSLAVDLSIQMRTQRAEYVMLPPLQPEYDTNGDLARTVHFNASLMNERSGETTSNEELEERQVVVKIVLFPLVVKKGDDLGEGEDEIVVCPAQVLVAKQGPNKKVVRVLSGAMEMTQPAALMSATSVGPQSTMDMSNVI